MNTASSVARIPAGFPLLDRGTLMTLLAHPMRLAILTVLSDGEAYGITDVAPLIHCSASNCSKHLQQLRKAGILTIGRGRLYRMVHAYNPNPGSRVLEFGHCTLYLDAAAAAQP